jgi:hypothetical protein
MVHRFRTVSVVVACVVTTTAFWALPATAEDAHGVHGSADESYAGGGRNDFENGLAPAVEVDFVDGHEVRVDGVDFEVVF